MQDSQSVTFLRLHSRKQVFITSSFACRALTSNIVLRVDANRMIFYAKPMTPKLRKLGNFD